MMGLFCVNIEVMPLLVFLIILAGCVIISITSCYPLFRLQYQ